MRVALLSYNAPVHSAAGNQLAQLLDFFAEQGHEARLLVQSGERLHPDVARFTRVVPQPIASGSDWEYLASCDLIHVAYSRPCALLQLLPLLDTVHGPRVVFHYQGVAPPETGDPATRREPLERGARQRGLVWCADHAIADSHFLAQELAERTEFPAEQIEPMFLPVALAPVAGGGDRDFLRRRLNLGDDAQVALCVGRLAADKRVPLLVEAVAQLRERRPTVHAVVVGDDREPAGLIEASACRALAQKLHIADRVHFLGQLDATGLAAACDAADVLALPSLHAGFGMPVVEAMARGLPVVASRSGALPETAGDAALTFAPNDAVDLARQMRRVLDSATSSNIDNDHATKPHIALVCHRFGPGVIGGAESSLRGMATALKQAGCHVEVFTTCTLSESRWRNEIPAGSVKLDGLTVHRYPIAPHDPEAFEESIRRIVERSGPATAEEEQAYLGNNLHAPALLEALGRREVEFDAIVAGPFSIGLTHDVASAFPAKTLLIPCFHDAPVARLSLWPGLCNRVGGLLFHSAEEQQFAQSVLGVNHPNSFQVGAGLKVADRAGDVRAEIDRPYLAYSGSFTQRNNVPLLLEWLSRYQSERPGRFDMVFLGQGDVPIPDETWLRNLGRVDEAKRNAVVAGARALVQLSRQDSLAAQEAWVHGTPVVVHQGCTVLAAQVRRADGGVAVGEYESFARALDDLWQSPAAWRERGENGRAHVANHCASHEERLDRILRAVAGLRRPIATLLRERGFKRAKLFTRQRWRECFAAWLDKVMAQPRRPFRDDLGMQPLNALTRVTLGTRTVLIPVRLFNWGSHAVLAEGPGATVVHAEVSELRSGQVVACATPAALPDLLLPGRSLTTVLTVPVPHLPGQFRVSLWTDRPGASRKVPFRQYLGMTVETQGSHSHPGCSSTYLEAIQQALPDARRLQSLPLDFPDHAEGFLGRLKRYIKRKIVNSFKYYYVDAISRQQTQVNGQLVLVVQQLTECCTTLDLAVRGLQSRIDQLEAKLNDTVLPMNHHDDNEVESDPILEEAA